MEGLELLLLYNMPKMMIHADCVTNCIDAYGGVVVKTM
jgi:hypothetical protein